MKKILVPVGRVILLLLSILVFLFSVGTLIPALPIVGSVANIVTVGFLHLWLPLCIALVLLSLVPALSRRGKAASWLGVDELDEVAWLPADQSLIPLIRAKLKE